MNVIEVSRRPIGPRWAPLLAALLFPAASGQACELCAIYSATTARGESSAGFVMTLSEQSVAMGTAQFESKSLLTTNPNPNAVSLHFGTLQLRVNVLQGAWVYPTNYVRVVANNVVYTLNSFRIWRLRAS